MKNSFITYLLTLVLLATVAIPSYISITEEICESSLVIDIEEESDNNSENSEKTEFKIVSLPPEISSIYKHSNKYQANIYITNQYDSIYKKLESPPPEYS